MQTMFYINQDQKNLGPFSLEDIFQKLQSKEISTSAYIYLEDKQDWVLLMDYEPLKSFKNKVPTTLKKETHMATAHTTLNNQEWYVLKWDNKYGPFSYIDIVKMLQSKSIFEFDYIWKTEFENWKRIAEVDDFKHEHIRHHFHNTKELDEKSVFFRRRHVRTSFNGSILVHDNANVWKGEAIEISEEGAGIVMNNASIVPGQSIYLHFKPGDSVPPFNAVCEVVSKTYKKDVKDRTTPVKYGVKFVKIQPGTKKAIKKYIMEKAG